MSKVYFWPDSQLCTGCRYGKFRLDIDSPCAYECEVNYKYNDGIDCPEFIKSDRKEGDEL